MDACVCVCDFLLRATRSNVKGNCFSTLSSRKHKSNGKSNFYCTYITVRITLFINLLNSMSNENDLIFCLKCSALR